MARPEIKLNVSSTGKMSPASTVLEPLETKHGPLEIQRFKTDIDDTEPEESWLNQSIARQTQTQPAPKRKFSTRNKYRNISLLASGILVCRFPCVLVCFVLYNAANAARFIKFYDRATAPVVGSDPPDMTIGLSSGSSFPMWFGEEDGWPFAQGLGIAATQLVADSDTTAPSANDVVVNLLFLPQP